MNIETTAEIEAALAAGAPVALGVSGGKDSGALAIALAAHLRARGVADSRIILVHADLGGIEWPQTAEWVQKLSDFLGLEVVTVRRRSGGLIERWFGRWANNIRRYAALECVTLIPPWSTPALRFCTSELKVDPITSALKKRFPSAAVIVNATGIRGQESKARLKQPISKEQAKLKRAGKTGLDWHPIHRWTIDEVLALHRQVGFPLHPAYTVYGSSRLSCSFCILASGADHKAAASFSGNEPSYLRLVELESESAFSFQSGKWLGDLRPDLLTPARVAAIAGAKKRAATRAAAEKRIPKDLLFTKGWPHRAPTHAEAVILSEVRTAVLDTAGLSSPFTTPQAIIDRYNELLALKAARAA